MNTLPNRMVIYPKDVKNITGRADSTARRILARIRKKNKKKKGEFVTIEEFCAATGLKPEIVSQFLR
jgi:hypothetical protein